MLTLKALSPTRLVKNELYQRIAEAEQQGATAEQLLELVPKGSARRGIFEDDIENGEVEIGQIASAIRSIDSVADVMQRLTQEFCNVQQKAGSWKS